MATDDKVPMRLSPEIRQQMMDSAMRVLNRIVWQEVGLRYRGEEIKAEGYTRQPFAPGKAITFNMIHGAFADEYVVYGTLDGVAVWASASLGPSQGWGYQLTYFTADAQPFKVEGELFKL